MNVCFVHTDIPTASTRWFLYPAQALDAKICTFGELERGAGPRADLYVIERETWRLPWARLGDRPVLCWLDDAYHLLPALAPNYRLWQQVMPDFKRNLRRCAGVIAPNPGLAADYAEHVPAVHVIPNYHAFPRFPDLPDRVPNLLGWGGSWCHWASWRDTNLYRQIPACHAVEIIGCHPVYDMLARQGAGVALVATLAFEDYLYRIARFGLYLIPAAGPYDRRRSWIKALEAAYVDVPWLALGDAAADVYRGCQGGYAWAGSLSAALIKRTILGCRGQGQKWAEEQRVTYHLAEWQAALRGV